MLVFELLVSLVIEFLMLFNDSMLFKTKTFFTSRLSLNGTADMGIQKLHILQKSYNIGYPLSSSLRVSVMSAWKN